VVSLGHLLFKIMDRYFIVFYDARNTRSHSVGNCWVQNMDGSYLNNRVVVKRIAELNPQFEEKDIVLTNVKELDKKDFEQFIKL